MRNKVLYVTEPELSKQWHPSKNSNLTPADVTRSSPQKVWWMCDKGHEWQATIYKRSCGTNCPICSNHQVLSGYNDLATLNPTLANQWHPTKNENLTPSDVTKSSGKKIWWLCKEGHEWEASISNRNKGRGCPFCSNKKVLKGYNDLVTTNPQLARQWHPTKNENLTPSDVTNNSNKKVWWLCDRGHEWEATIASRNSGNGCPGCSGSQVLVGINDLTTKYPLLTKEWHPTKNEGLLPTQVTSKTHNKAWWICQKGHEWEASINNRTAGNGCPICSSSQVLAGYNDLATLNSNLAKEWHPTKNGNMTAHTISKSSSRKVWWVCDKGHEWYASVSNRNKGTGCPICSNKQVLVGYNDLVTTDPALAKEWHPRKNTHITPYDITKGSNKKVWWLCDKGHEWRTTPSHRSSGTGCPICSESKLIVGYNDLATVRPDIVKEWHPIKNGDLKPSDLVRSSPVKVWWECEKGHIWKTSVHSRNNGSRCPHCTKELRTSFAQESIYFYLKKIFADTQSSYTINEREADVYIPQLKFIIEYDGYFYHKDKYQQDLLKNEVFQEYTFLRIREPKLLEVNNYNCKNYLLKGIKTKDHEKMLRYIMKHIYQSFCLDSDILKALQNIDINLKRDETSIYSQYISINKENSLSMVNKEVSKEWHPVKNGKLESTHVLSRSNKKVWWLCSEGHEWEATINNRSSGNGCPICSNNQVLAGFNDLATTNSNLAHEWHPTKNEKLKPCQVTKSSGKKVWWLCKKGHEWHATIASRNAGVGCPICSNKQILRGYNDLLSTHSELSKEWHPSKNRKVFPWNISYGSDKKVWWICEKGHEWQANVSGRSSGEGCPICASKKLLKGYNDLATTNPVLAKQWHPSKNGALQPCDVMRRSSKKAWWMCNKGHEWSANVSNRSSGKGCPICSNNQILAGYNDLTTTNPILAKQWHPSKNTPLDIFTVACNSHHKVWWICEKGHEWQATISCRNQGDNCPICSNQKVLQGYNDLITTNFELAKQWHSTKNKQLKPTNVTQGSGKKVWWICEKGHEWQAIVRDRNRGTGCPICSNQKILVGYNDLATTNPELTQQWHPTKNKQLKPIHVTRGSNKKAWWICEKNHEWQATISSRNRGNGCPICSGKQTKPYI